MSERWDDAETQAWQQARAARLREAVARLEGRDEHQLHQGGFIEANFVERVRMEPAGKCDNGHDLWVIGSDPAPQHIIGKDDDHRTLLGCQRLLDVSKSVQEGAQDGRTGSEGTRAGSDASERLTRAHRRSVLSHDPPDAPNGDLFPPHEVVDPPAAGDVWWRKRARYGR